MSYALVGPYPFDPKTVVASTRAALSHVGEQLRTGAGEELVASSASGLEAGLHFLLQHDGEGGAAVIAGYWLVMDGEYLSSGPLGPPDRVPPFAPELLDAATEEVWWKNLQVNLDRDGVWRPLIVLEWPPHMASRASVPPPGVPLHEEAAPEDEALEERETWLEAVGDAHQPAETEIPTYEEQPKAIDRYEGLDEERSLIVLVRGTMRYDRRLHTGTFFMIPPEIFEDGTTSKLRLDDWIDATHDLVAEDVETLEEIDDERHQLGKPLELFGGRVGFHSSGWLTRNLGIWPARPSDIAVGSLTDRVVQQKWIAQAWTALTSTVVVLTVVLGFSGLVAYLAKPTPQPMTPPPAPAPQPALSVCSADYPDFVNEFRCQIERLAASGSDRHVSPVCRDKGSNEVYLAEQRDLRADLCALIDREEDGFTIDLGRGDRANFADFAASQACFNVLGYPYTYELRSLSDDGGTGRTLGNPVAFLEDEELGIQPLVELMDDLRTTCQAYKDRTEARVSGAVFATHVGSPLSDSPARERGGASLRRNMYIQAMVGVTNDASACFKRGMEDGLDAARYEGMCIPEGSTSPDRVDREAERIDIWVKLRGEESVVPEVRLIDRYARARFSAPKVKTKPLWQCHLALSTPEDVVLGRRFGRWDIPVPVPATYDVRGRGVKNQLQLDASLRGFEELGTDAGVCWQVVSKRLSAYSPVHPLLTADLDADGWPSEEQRLCGQVCAARFNIRRSVNDAGWYTREADLSMCVSTEPGDEADQGQGALDRLRIPWNEARGAGWVEPTEAQVCAFNLVAQDLMPELEEGYIVRGRVGKEFGGETVSGSRIVGGRRGLAARYVPGLAFGRRDSVQSTEACGHVATQCFTSLLLDVTGDDTVERYQWSDTWSARVEALASMRRSQLAEVNPWCVGLKDYLLKERAIAQFDTPCVDGVEDARENTLLALRSLEAEGAIGTEE